MFGQAGGFGGEPGCWASPAGAYSRVRPIDVHGATSQSTPARVPAAPQSSPFGGGGAFGSSAPAFGQAQAAPGFGVSVFACLLRLMPLAAGSGCAPRDHLRPGHNRRRPAVPLDSGRPVQRQPLARPQPPPSTRRQPLPARRLALVLLHPAARLPAPPLHSVLRLALEPSAMPSLGSGPRPAQQLSAAAPSLEQLQQRPPLVSWVVAAMQARAKQPPGRTATLQPRRMLLLRWHAAAAAASTSPLSQPAQHSAWRACHSALGVCRVVRQRRRPARHWQPSGAILQAPGQGPEQLGGRWHDRVLQHNLRLADVQHEVGGGTALGGLPGRREARGCRPRPNSRWVGCPARRPGLSAHGCMVSTLVLHHVLPGRIRCPSQQPLWKQLRRRRGCCQPLWRWW
jgi:hypothetical protein